MTNDNIIMTNIIRIPDIQKYNITFEDNILVLTPKITYKVVTEDELYLINLLHSTIIKSVILNEDEIISEKTKYASILIDIYKSMPIQKIVQNTSMNIKLTNENGKNGYIFHPELNISMQRKDAKGTIKEIINFVKFNNYKMEIYIQIKNNGNTETIYMKV
jgi:hypothetical protein